MPHAPDYSPANFGGPVHTFQSRAAQVYARRGWAVLPCAPGGKLPLLPNGYCGASCDPDIVARWWRAEPRANVGLVPARCPHPHAGPDGPEPGTLLVLDLDGPVGAATAAALAVPADTMTVATGRSDGGLHRWFTVPAALDGVPLALGNRALGPGIDVRHVRGFVVAPPSVHPSGAPYRWTVHGEPSPLPPALLARLRARAAVDAGPTATHGRASGASRLSARNSGENSGGNRGDRRDAGPLRRALAYVRRVPVGLADGRGRNATAYRLAAFLVHDAGLGARDAADLLATWNATNRPPLAPATLARVADNAARYGRPRVIGRRAA